MQCISDKHDFKDIQFTASDHCVFCEMDSAKQLRFEISKRAFESNVYRGTCQALQSKLQLATDILNKHDDVSGSTQLMTAYRLGVERLFNKQPPVKEKQTNERG